MTTTPPPLNIPSDLDWPLVAGQVREATQALVRLRLDLASTDLAWIVSQFEPIAYDLGVTRVVVANRGPVDIDLGDRQDPVDLPTVPSNRRKPITPDQWRTLSATAELIHDRLVTLAAIPDLDPRLVARLDRAAELHRSIWMKVVEGAGLPHGPPAKLHRQRFRTTAAARAAKPRRRKSG